jgi:dihydroxyacetone kinase
LALDDVMRLGGAKPGDKTLVDSFVPFVEALEKASGEGAPIAAAWSAAADICEEAAQATAPMRPRLGRARPLADRSVGHPDAGATSLGMVAKTIAGLL